MKKAVDTNNFEPGFIAAGHKILVYVFPYERIMESGIVIPEETAKREDMKQERALVVNIGPTAWLDTPGGRNRENAWAMPGDIVYISRFAGYRVVGKDGIEYRIINDLDITLIEVKDDAT